jgi:hypothetical protein
MPGGEAIAMKAVPKAVSECEWVEPDPFVELEVDPPGDPLAAKNVRRHHVLSLQDLDPVKPLSPGSDMLLVDEKESREPIWKRRFGAVDDPTLEEDAVG